MFEMGTKIQFFQISLMPFEIKWLWTDRPPVGARQEILLRLITRISAFHQGLHPLKQCRMRIVEEHVCRMGCQVAQVFAG